MSVKFKERFKGKTSTVNRQGNIGEAPTKPVPVGRQDNGARPPGLEHEAKPRFQSIPDLVPPVTP